MYKLKKMNRVINSVGMVLFAFIIIGTAAAITGAVSHAQVLQRLPSTPEITTPGANPV